MPRLNHENLGSIQRTAYLTATVVSTDSEFDTMEFTGIGQCPSGSNVPIFYHCDKDSVQRDNGALEGASDAFSEGDEVIVQCEVVDSTTYKPLYVIGFVDKPKGCCVFKEHWGDTLCANNDGWYFSGQPLCTLSPFASLADGILSVSVSNNTVHLSKSYDFVLSPTTFVPKEIKIKITASASTSEIHSVWVGLGLKTDLTGWHFFVFAQDNLAPDPDMYYIGDGELVIDISDYYEISDNDNLQQLDVRCYGLGGGASYSLDYVEIKGKCVPW